MACSSRCAAAKCNTQVSHHPHTPTQLGRALHGRCMTPVVVVDDLHRRAHVARHGVDVDALGQRLHRVEVPQAVERELVPCAVAHQPSQSQHHVELIDQGGDGAAIAHAEHEVAGFAFAPQAPHALQVEGGGHTRHNHALAYLAQDVQLGFAASLSEHRRMTAATVFFG